jgi:hypothetical protein
MIMRKSMKTIGNFHASLTLRIEGFFSRARRPSAATMVAA